MTLYKHRLIFGGNASFTTMAEVALDFAATHKRTHYLWWALYITRFTPTCDHVPLCQTFYPHLHFFPLVLARSMMFKALRINFSIHCKHHCLLKMQPLLPMPMPIAYAKLCSFRQEVWCLNHSASTSPFIASISFFWRCRQAQVGDITRRSARSTWRKLRIFLRKRVENWCFVSQIGVIPDDQAFELTKPSF